MNAALKRVNYQKQYHVRWGGGVCQPLRVQNHNHEPSNVTSPRRFCPNTRPQQTLKYAIVNVHSEGDYGIRENCTIAPLTASASLRIVRHHMRMLKAGSVVRWLPIVIFDASLQDCL